VSAVLYQANETDLRIGAAAAARSGAAKSLLVSLLVGDVEGAAVTLRAGSGIVADSDPDAEAAETNVKLATVLDAVVPGASASAQLR